MIFVLAFDHIYQRMAQATINALNFYHNNPTIIIYTDERSREGLMASSLASRNVEIRVFKDVCFSCGQWHPLIWAKLEAFRLPTSDYVVVLDADMIVYRNLDAFAEELHNSGKSIGASTDFAPFVKQFNSGFDFHQYFFSSIMRDDRYLIARAFNAGALVLKPDVAIYHELIGLAKRYHHLTFYPEQAILNLFAYQTDSWLAQDMLSIMPFSVDVCHPEKQYGMIHCFTPRPDFMLPAIVREGEPTLELMMECFEATYKRPYPLERIRTDYFERLHGMNRGRLHE